MGAQNRSGGAREKSGVEPETLEDKLLQEANARLKAGRVGLAIRRKDNKLHLRGMMPSPKDPGKKVRRDLSLKINASVAGIQVAEEEARRISVQIARGQQPELTFGNAQDGGEKKLSDWIESYTKAYRRRRGDRFNPMTWEKDYLFVYKQLDGDRVWDDEYLLKFIEQSSNAGTRSRVRFVNAIRALAKHAGRELDTDGMAAGYEAAKVPRILPDDKQIVDVWREIRDTGLLDWAWVFGTIATYGLRPHEVYRLNTSLLQSGEQEYVRVQKNSKTGERDVFPVWPEWVDEFGLRDVRLPHYAGAKGDDNLVIGNKVTGKFGRDIGVPFKLYNLRHKYAVRCIEFGVSDTMAAQFMGHSVEVHRKTYQRWLSTRDKVREFERLKQVRQQSD